MNIMNDYSSFLGQLFKVADSPLSVPQTSHYRIPDLLKLAMRGVVLARIRGILITR